jgi:hypothetical protein
MNKKFLNRVVGRIVNETRIEYIWIEYRNSLVNKLTEAYN